MINTADSHIPFVQDYFAAYGELRLIDGRTVSRADVQAADILLVRSITPVDEKLLAGTRVKFVGSVTAGADTSSNRVDGSSRHCVECSARV